MSIEGGLFFMETANGFTAGVSKKFSFLKKIMKIRVTFDFLTQSWNEQHIRVHTTFRREKILTPYLYKTHTLFRLHAKEICIPKQVNKRDLSELGGLRNFLYVDVSYQYRPTNFL